MEEYNKLTDNQEKAAWLRAYGKSDIPCSEILKAHTLSDEKIETGKGKSLIKTWSEIQNLIGKINYEYYVSFEIDDKTNDILDLVLISKFILNPPCYSAPLFRCIAKEHNLDVDSVFEFFNAEIEKESKIVIKVEDEIGFSLYDLGGVPL